MVRKFKVQLASVDGGSVQSRSLTATRCEGAERARGIAEVGRGVISVTRNRCVHGLRQEKIR